MYQTYNNQMNNSPRGDYNGNNNYGQQQRGYQRNNYSAPAQGAQNAQRGYPTQQSGGYVAPTQRNNNAGNEFTYKEGMAFLFEKTDKKTEKSPDYWGKIRLNGTMYHFSGWKSQDGGISLKFNHEGEQRDARGYFPKACGEGELTFVLPEKDTQPVIKGQATIDLMNVELAFWEGRRQGVWSGKAKMDEQSQQRSVVRGARRMRERFDPNAVGKPRNNYGGFRNQEVPHNTEFQQSQSWQGQNMNPQGNYPDEQVPPPGIDDMRW